MLGKRILRNTLPPVDEVNKLVEDKLPPCFT